MGLSSSLAQCALDFLVAERCHSCGASLDNDRNRGSRGLAAPVDVFTLGRFRLQSRLLCAPCAARVRPWNRPVRLPSRAGSLSVHAAFVTDDRLLAIVHLLKFGRRERIAPWLARAIASVLDAPAQRAPAPERLVVPVPMDTASRRRRGFNQAESIGRALAAQWGLEFQPRALAKVRRTAPQSALGRAERLTNLEDAFLADAAAVRGRGMVVVDDLVTTGATVGACAHALRRAGAAEVVVVCAGYRDEADAARRAFLQS